MRIFLYHQTLFLLLWFSLLTTSNSFAEEPILRVSAAASLAHALKEINTEFTKKSGTKVELNLGASNALARQIEAGAPIDVFISADLAKMDSLTAKGLVQSEPRENQLSNALVIVVPKDSSLQITSLKDLIDDNVSKIATGDPKAVPVGVYAKTYLEKEGLWENVKSKIVATDHVRSALAAVESGNIDVGIVYKTDAAISNKVKVVFEIPLLENQPIIYPMASLKDAPHPKLAALYLEFLDRPTSKEIFAKYGFIVLPESIASTPKKP